MTENQRLKIVRLNLGLSQRDFSQALELKQGSYSDVERGKAGISVLVVKNLIRRFRVNPLWLYEGEGDMFVFSKPIKTSRKGNKDSAEFGTERVDKNRDSVTEKDDLINQIERQRQYIESIQGALSFLKD
jgi:transcriptional regulator with XRE-family HTH domain